LFFHNSYLEPIDVDEAVQMLGQIASLRRVGAESRELAIFLQSAEGRARVRAVQHLAGGNPRVYTLFAQFITKESLDDLVDAFMKMMDDLTPYYQSRMKDLSNQQMNCFWKDCCFRCKKNGWRRSHPMTGLLKSSQMTIRLGIIGEVLCLT
jgi:hypothetical protein